MLIDGFPAYMRDVAGASMTSAGLASAAPQLAVALLTALGAIAADWLRGPRGLSTGVVRRLIHTVGELANAALLLLVISGALATLGEPAVVGVLSLAVGVGGLTVGGGFNVNHLDVLPSAAGILLGALGRRPRGRPPPARCSPLGPATYSKRGPRRHDRAAPSARHREHVRQRRRRDRTLRDGAAHRVPGWPVRRGESARSAPPSFDEEPSRAGRFEEAQRGSFEWCDRAQSLAPCGRSREQWGAAEPSARWLAGAVAGWRRVFALAVAVDLLGALLFALFASGERQHWAPRHAGRPRQTPRGGGFRELSGAVRAP